MTKMHTLVFSVGTIAFASCSIGNQARITPSQNLPPAALGAMQAEDARIEWLRRYASVVRSVDPLDEDYSDLEPLAAAIGDAQVVMLGEGSHAAGSAIALKARITRFLHAERGFTVLAIESGLYDVDKSWRLMAAGEDPLSAVRRGVFAVWTNTAEFSPVIDLVASSAHSRRPLRLVGFDSQLTGSASRDFLLEDLRTYLAGLGITSPVLSDGSAIARAITTRGTPAYVVPDSSFAREVSVLRAEVARFSRRRATRRDEFWKQLLSSLAGEAENYIAINAAKSAKDSVAEAAAWLRAADGRDFQMARNVIWLANVGHPREKIIVWAATAHTLYRRAPRVSGSPSVPMGETVKKELGRRVYSIAVTAREGELGNPRWPSYRQEVRPDSSAIPSFENLMHAAGHRLAFLDFRAPGRGGGWLEVPLPGRFADYETLIAPWPAVMDGAFYIDTMRPATARSP